MTREELLQSLQAVLTRPASARELLQVLRVPREARVTFRRLLRALAADGSIIQVRGRRYALPGSSGVVVGTLQMHPDGYGFVTPDRDAEAGDVYVGRAGLKDAVHGDRVTVRAAHRRGDCGREGRITRIVERRPGRTVGQVQVDAAGRVHVVPHDRRLLHRILVPTAESRDARTGEMVEAEITRWPTVTRGPIGRVVEILGRVDAPGVDTTVVLRTRGIVEPHSGAAIDEARRLGPAVRPADLAGRTDFRNQLTVTIDGEDARDFDDAVSVEVRGEGRFRLWVHIADVSHYVRTGSALDDEARERGTSIYFPDRAVHMFPAELAAGLCSLIPGVDRLVQSCAMDVDGQGEVVGCEFHDGVIRSHARLTYTAVNALLTGQDRAAAGDDPALVSMLDGMRDLYDILHERRRRRGSIDFDLPEPEIQLDDEGQVAAITASERNIAHRLIEEFMLLANETVASALERRGVPTIYRIHEAPDPAKVALFEEFISTLGHTLGIGASAARPRDFQQLIERVAGSAVERPVAFLMLRTMPQARYDVVNVGHFGLAARTYTHFTSPIRRYPDLVVHRLLREARKGGLAEARREALAVELPAVAALASARERRAIDAERELVQWKKVRFMSDKVGDEFDGYVTGVSAFGLFVELVEHFVEGLVHLSSLIDDDYRYLEKAHVVRGARTRRIYRLGDRVRVRVIRVDTDRRLIDFGLVEQLEAMESRAVCQARSRRGRRPASDRRRHTPRQPPRGKGRRRR